MRITKTPLNKKYSEEISLLTLKAGRLNDEEVATDFSKDIYSLFADGPVSINNPWEIFENLRKLFVKWQLDDLTNSIQFYSELRKFLYDFSEGEFYQQLKKHDPMVALSIFLGLFKPPKSNCSSGGGSGSDKQNQSQSPTPGNSNKNLPIDLDAAKKYLPKLNQISKAGLLDDRNIQDLVYGYGSDIRNIELSDLTLSLIDELSNNISNKELTIFEIARHKEFIDSYKFSEDLTTSQFPQDEIDITKISSISDYPKTILSEMADDDDIFFTKLAKNDLLVKEYITRQRRKQALYLLVDVSGSMNGIRSLYASAVALSMVRQAIKNEATYFLRFFDYDAKPLYRVKTQEEALEVEKILLQQPFSGGGTNIRRAITQAVKDINKDKEKFDKVEIMVITDGDDYIDIAKEALGKIKIHSTLIDGENSTLRKISDTYLNLNSYEIIRDFNLNNN